ncbi:hypothetical protein HPC37_02770 [Pasteurellaceae bacterium 20609_3]|nr:hypothetical protein [Spirabiliibacterium mucosae]
MDEPLGEGWYQVPDMDFARPLYDYVFDGEGIKLDYSPAEYLPVKKADKLSEVNFKAEAFVYTAARTYEVPEFEKNTWVLQAKESKAWKADPSTPTPLMDMIAKQRDVPRELLLEKAYAKAVKFEMLTACVAGQRQKHVDRINAAQTLEDLDFEVEYKCEM